MEGCQKAKDLSLLKKKRLSKSNNFMENQIKIGGCYKTKEGWLLVQNKSSSDTWHVRDIIVEDGIYDEDIIDMSAEDIAKVADLSVCYRPYYHKKKGLYKAWDETKPREEAIEIQKI